MAMVEGAQSGLDALTEVRHMPGMENYHLLHATLAEFSRQLGDSANAHASYARALELTASEPQRRFLKRRLDELELIT